MALNPVNSSFCDWLSVSQTFPHKIPEHGSDYTICYDTETGEVKYEKYKPVDHKGSHDTNVRVSSNGYRLTLSGNIGRYRRPDNLFGFTLEDCKRKANLLLQELDLPVFEKGQYFDYQSKSGRRSQGYTGAKISRVDITTNYSLCDDASDFMYWLGCQKIGRSKMSAYEGECVYWGSINYALSKCYLKGPEMAKRLKQRQKKHTLSASDEEYLKRLVEYCDNNGTVRHEVRFSERFLNQNNLKAWCNPHSELEKHYKKELNKMTERCELENTSVDDLSPAAKATYYDYIAGHNVKAKLTKSTWYRHRTEIFRMGVDISVPPNVRALSVKPRTIDIKPAEMPEFYKTSSHLRLVSNGSS